MSNTKFTRTVLVTGATSGLGYEAAKQIASHHPDYLIIIAARSNPNDAATEINTSLHQTNVQFRALDLGSLASVRSFASKWHADNLPPIQSLVLNAALQFPGDVEYTTDGFEKTFGISHVGHALLFGLLRPLLADEARVVLTSSGTHDPAQKSGMPDATFNTAEEMAHPTVESAKAVGRQRYTSVKLANVLFGYALHRRFEAANARHGKKWTVTSFDPGLMPGTGLARNAGGFMNFVFRRVLPSLVPLLRKLYNPNVHTPKESGTALARLAVGRDVEGLSGVYFEGLREIKSSVDSYDQAKQEDLWQWSVATLAKDEDEKKLFDLADLM